jgi:hypothetical protein
MGATERGRTTMAKNSAFLMGAVLLVAGLLTNASAPARPLGMTVARSFGSGGAEGDSAAFGGLEVKILKARINLQNRLVVSWRARNQHTVASYQVWGSASPRSVLRQISEDILPENGSYIVKFPSQSAGYVQVHAVMVDGSVQASNTVKVGK